MKTHLIALALTCLLSFPVGAAQAGQKAAVPPAAKVQKQQTKAAPKVAPLAATILKVDVQALTVRTEPLMGPDGLIPSQEKTYQAGDAMVVLINGEVRKLADLVAGEPVRLKLTDDGKIIQGVEAKFLTPEAKAAKKSIK